MKTSDTQFKLIIPGQLKAQLDGAATSSRRSLSSEIVQRLQDTFDFPPILDHDSPRSPIKQEDFDLLRTEAADARRALEDLVSKGEVWKDLYLQQNDLTRQYAGLAKALCHTILSHGDNVPADLAAFADELLPSFTWLRENEPPRDFERRLAAERVGGTGEAPEDA
ncbi:Arc family DNA-binding protein [Rhizobium sp. TH2]|uniref:Arc family DNA-binding protein n=1 Tax=Rhizobium sp. TH2 TaxID=2775403 RepID=UPI002157A8D8|nr:Arc family DNA-binding protein [Rhizobium sp. TH2]UVC08659.1 Arc family DNA-binding protein [Rhizobium sp. TH2]